MECFFNKSLTERGELALIFYSKLSDKQFESKYIYIISSKFDKVNFLFIFIIRIYNKHVYI